MTTKGLHLTIMYDDCDENGAPLGGDEYSHFAVIERESGGDLWTIHGAREWADLVEELYRAADELGVNLLDLPYTAEEDLEFEWARELEQTRTILAARGFGKEV